MEPTVRQTKPLTDITLLNPATGLYEAPHLTIEMDPISQCIVAYQLGFEKDEDAKGDEQHDHGQKGA